MKGGGKGGMRYTKKKGKIEMLQESFFYIREQSQEHHC